MIVSNVMLFAAPMVGGDLSSPESRTGAARNSQSSAVGTPSNGAVTDTDLTAAANALFVTIDPARSENRYFPAFAQQQIRWVLSEQRAGRLSVMLLASLANTNLTPADFMASGPIDGKLALIIAKPRFLRFLEEEGHVSPPFTRLQRNDFLLGVLHEAVHLQGPSARRPATGDDRLAEEFRTWREVDRQAVRPLRRLQEPMNRRLIEADDALRACGDQWPCRGLASIMLPREVEK